MWDQIRVYEISGGLSKGEREKEERGRTETVG